jgi:hypothetical protein
MHIVTTSNYSVVATADVVVVVVDNGDGPRSQLKK